MLRTNDAFNYQKVDEIINHLRNDQSIIDFHDLGAGSVSGDGSPRRVSQFVRHSSISHKYGRLLSRIVHSIKPSTIIELGTGAGFSAMYMGMAYDHCKIFSIEGCPTISELANLNIKRLGLKNTEIHTGPFKEILPFLLKKIQHPLLVFIDGDHSGEHLIQYYETILPFADENTLIVLDDIHWSECMEKAWKAINKREEISISIDLFRMGILFLKKNIRKHHLLIKF